MRAKPDLAPDCDIHGAPMYQSESPASALGLKGNREVTIWRCTRDGCDRYFHGTVGYRSSTRVAVTTRSPQCTKEGAFLVVQQPLGAYICPVSGCPTVQEWERSDEWRTETADARAAAVQ